jgi:hypothetical protein
VSVAGGGAKAGESDRERERLADRLPEMSPTIAARCRRGQTIAVEVDGQHLLPPELVDGV